jgi:putative PIN family toxin of toxin-antitoxin system
MTNNRFVLDTNVFVSAALFPGSKPDTVVREVLRTGELLASLKTLEELREVLNRKKFERYINRDDKEDFLRDVVDRSTIIEPNSRISICRDPKDNQILELAISGKADLIITGDDDLLVLNPFQFILIVTPDAWLQDFSTP